MNKTFQYRLYPTKKQQTTLNRWLALCCETYNAALQERRDAYRLVGTSPSYAQQCAELPGCKEVRPELGEVHSQVLQDVLRRVDLAFASFFRRCQAGEKPGYPRYRSRTRYDSLTFKQYGNSFNVQTGNKQQGTLILSKIGHVKMVMHRPLCGTPKTAIVKRTPTGKWYVSIACEQAQHVALPPTVEQVGIDVGLKTFAYLSDGTTIENPRFFRQEERNLAKAQRQRARTAKGSKERRKLNKRVARVHERIGHRRKNFIEQETRKLINRYGLIALEALSVRNMIQHPRLAKSIADAAWSSFGHTLIAKAEEAERTIVRVNPAYSSQTCSACGRRQEMPLSVRVYECPHCGLLMNRDHNSSVNILDEALDVLQACGRAGRVIPEAPGAGAAGSRHSNSRALARSC